MFSRLWKRLKSEKTGTTLVYKVGVFLENLLSEPEGNWAIVELKRMGPAVVQKAREKILQGSVVKVVSSPENQVYQLRFELVQASDVVRIGFLLGEDKFKSKKQLIYDGLNEDWSDKFTEGYQWSEETVSVLVVFAGVGLFCLVYLMELIEGESGEDRLKAYIESYEELLRKIFQIYIAPTDEKEPTKADANSQKLDLFLKMEELRNKYLGVSREPDPSFLADFLVMQFLGEKHFGIENDTFESFVDEVPEGVRGLTKVWVLTYISWLFKALATETYGQEIGEAMAKHVDERLQKAESMEGSLAGLSNTIEFWFSQLDQATSHIGTKIEGHEVPLEVFAAMRFLALDGSSPYYKKTDHPPELDFDVATALEKGKEATKYFIAGAVKKAVEIDSWPPT